MKLKVRLLVATQAFMVMYAVIMHVFADHHDVLINVARVGIVGKTPLDKEAMALKLNSAVSDLIAESKEAFGTTRIQTLKNAFWDDSLETFVEGGSCGNAAQLLTELLIDAGIDARISQMTCGSQLSCHVLVEADLGYGDIVLDPLYGFAFRNPDGKLASAAEISSDWDFYRLQVPAGYDAKYRFEAVTHTNWQKVPVVLPLAKKLLDVTLGEREADRISLRIYFLNIYRVHEIVAIFMFLLLGVIEIFIVRPFKK